MLCKVRSKVVPVYAMKAYKGSRSIAPLIVNLGAKWSHLHEPAVLHPEREHRYPLIIRWVRTKSFPDVSEKRKIT